MITLVWTKSKAPLSKLIRWGLREPVSHFAVCLDHRIVFHSNLIGTHLKWRQSFEKHSEIVDCITIPMSFDQEEYIYQQLILLDERPYDFKAFAFFTISALKSRLTREPLPRSNPWASGKGLLCTEVALALKDIIPMPENLDIISPYQLYLHIKRLISDGTIKEDRHHLL